MVTWMDKLPLVAVRTAVVLRVLGLRVLGPILIQTCHVPSDCVNHIFNFLLTGCNLLGAQRTRVDVATRIGHHHPPDRERSCYNIRQRRSLELICRCLRPLDVTPGLVMRSNNLGGA